MLLTVKFSIVINMISSSTIKIFVVQTFCLPDVLVLLHLSAVENHGSASTITHTCRQTNFNNLWNLVNCENDYDDWAVFKSTKKFKFSCITFNNDIIIVIKIGQMPEKWEMFHNIIIIFTYHDKFLLASRACKNICLTSTLKIMF